MSVNFVKQSIAAFAADRDAHIASFTPTQNFGSIATLNAGFTTKNSNVFRALVGFTPPEEIPLGSRIVSATLTINVTVPLVATNVASHVYPVLREDWVETEVTWNIFKTSNDWGDPGCSEDGVDYDAGEGDAFNMPAGTGLLALDVTNSTQAMVDLEHATFTYLIRNDTENDASNFIASSRTGATPPTLAIEYIPPPYSDWLEEGSYEALFDVTSASFNVGLVLGTRTFGANDRIRVRYGTAADLTGATNGTYLDVSSGTAGDAIKVIGPASGASNTVKMYFQIQVSDDAGVSVAHSGEIRGPFYLTPLPATRTQNRVIFCGEGHDDKAVLASEVDEEPARINVLTLTEQNVRARIVAANAAGTLPITRIFRQGDDDGFCKYQGALFNFPRGADLLPDVAADTAYATDEADVAAVNRLDRSRHELPTDICPKSCCKGNHSGYHSYHRQAFLATLAGWTGDGAGDLATWNHAAQQAYHGWPASVSTDVETDGTPFSWHSDGYDWAEVHGNACFIHIDIGRSSMTGGPVTTALTANQINGVSPVPVSMSNQYDWHVDTDSRDFIEDTVTALAGTVQWFFLRMHHPPLGGHTGPSQYAHWGSLWKPGNGNGNNSAEWGGSAGWVADDRYSNPADYLATGLHGFLVSLLDDPRRIIVSLGHDHLFTHFDVDGILYWCCPQAAGSETGVYDDGFNAGHTPWRPNAGYVVVTYDASTVTLEYRRTYLADTGDDDPSDGIVTNDDIVETVVHPTQGGGRLAGRSSAFRLSARPDRIKV